MPVVDAASLPRDVAIGGKSCHALGLVQIPHYLEASHVKYRSSSIGG
ncbi:MAG: hypothetical protein WCF23_16385 [Candidatus Nitrosopolaris sp.]